MWSDEETMSFPLLSLQVSQKKKQKKGKKIFKKKQGIKKAKRSQRPHQKKTI